MYRQTVHIGHMLLCSLPGPPPHLHSLTLTVNLNFRLVLSGRTKEQKEQKREGRHFLSPSKPSLWPYDPAQGQIGLPALPSLFPASSTPSHILFLRHIWRGQSWLGDKRKRHESPHLPGLFDFFLFHVTFQHWWSINRLWPLMPQLSCVWVREHVCAHVSGGGCITMRWDFFI